MKVRRWALQGTGACVIAAAQADPVADEIANAPEDGEEASDQPADLCTSYLAVFQLEPSVQRSRAAASDTSAMPQHQAQCDTSVASSKPGRLTASRQQSQPPRAGIAMTSAASDGGWASSSHKSDSADVSKYAPHEDTTGALARVMAAAQRESMRTLARRVAASVKRIGADLEKAAA